MHIRLLFTLFTLTFFLQNLSAKDLKWSADLTFLSFLEKYNIPLKTYYNMDSEDKELIQEIRSGQNYSVDKKNGKITTIHIPVSDELMLEIKRNKDEYSAKYVPIPYAIVEKTISIKIKDSFEHDLDKATKTSYYSKELNEVYSKAIPFKNMKKGDRVIIFYTQKYRNGKVFSSPIIQACLIEIDKKPFYGFLMDDEKYYDSLGHKYERTYQSTFIRPLRKFKRISSYFTHRRFHPILKRYRAHLGIDYAARPGRAVVASSSGTISFKGWKGGYGRVIEIKHANNIKTLYAHMKGFGKGMKKGRKVKQGETIGYVGTSGRSTGPHLHFGLYKNKKAVNPGRYIQKKISQTVAKIEGKEYQKLRKSVRKFRPQFKESKSKTILKEKSEECLDCLKK